MIKTHFQLVAIIFVTLVLGACTSPGGYQYKSWDFNNQGVVTAQDSPGSLENTTEDLASSPQPDPIQPPKIVTPPIKVALLLPMSGQHKTLGDAMLQAAQMALFDVQHDNFELMPRDTKGTPDGAKQAAHSALDDGAQLILGPLFSGSVKAVKDVTSNTNVNVIAFSTDWTLASSNTFIMGFVPFDQVERIMRYAKSNGLDDIGILAPNNDYGRLVSSAAQSIAPQINVRISREQKITANMSDAAMTVRQFTDHDSTERPTYKAVLMPMGGNTATSISGLISKYGLPPSQVVRLGTGLMDDKKLIGEANLVGTKFAAPSPALRRSFEGRYRSTYDRNPPRLATLAYDATALASVLARRSAASGRVGSIFNSKAIMNPNGFSGIDGIFRFRPNGVAERGLAVLEFRKGRIDIVEDAPDTFLAYRDF